MRRSPHGWSLLGMLAALSAARCGPAAIDGGFDSPNPSARAYAIEQAAEARDLAAIPQIVEELDADDPMVRLVAISALERMTGQTMGYHHEDAPEVRDEAIQRWVHAVNAGQFAGMEPHQSGEGHDG